MHCRACSGRPLLRPRRKTRSSCSWISFEDESRIVPAKAEIIGDRNLDRHIRDVLDIRHVVKVAIRVRRFIVDCRRDRIGLQNFAANCSLDAACSTEQMSDCPFGGAHLELRGMLAKNSLVSERLKLIIQGSGRAVSIDVLHIARRNPRTTHRLQEAIGHAFALRVGRSNVMRVAIGGIPGELAVNPRATRESVFLRFEKQHSCTLSHHKT
mmetsp:Transcript_27917/g.56195  ORF Transcript_27917/g.56195 Transcript_27917/m.56195 type:complete len:211 (-) Transcript_27917:878-1510(-)